MRNLLHVCTLHNNTWVVASSAKYDTPLHGPAVTVSWIAKHGCSSTWRERLELPDSVLRRPPLPLGCRALLLDSPVVALCSDDAGCDGFSVLIERCCMSSQQLYPLPAH